MFDSLAAFLLGTGPSPPAETLRAARLGGYAYWVLPPEHPLRSELRIDFANARVRHELIRREMKPLFAAWASAGIRVLLFKGFYLAEFVYPERGTRFHGDVDVVIPPEAAEEALRVARALGWAVELNPDAHGMLDSHCLYSIFRPGGAAMVDVHRRIIHSHTAWSGVPGRVTEAVWRSARAREWEGTTVWEPHPTDALLVGLVLQRAWGDRWSIKPHDVVDFRMLRERLGVTREDLRARARELGCERTLARFLTRCDPDAGRLDLGPVTPRQVWWRDITLAGERLPRGIERFREKVRIALEVPGDVLRALPLVLRTRRATRRSADRRVMLESLTPAAPPGREPSAHARWRAVRGIRWLTAPFPFDPGGEALVRSVAIYAALRLQGWPVVFVSGVSRGGPAGGERCWVELDGRPLWELHDPRLLANYQGTFRYPADPAPLTQRTTSPAG